MSMTFKMGGLVIKDSTTSFAIDSMELEVDNVLDFGRASSDMLRAMAQIAADFGIKPKHDPNQRCEDYKEHAQDDEALERDDIHDQETDYFKIAVSSFPTGTTIIRMISGESNEFLMNSGQILDPTTIVIRRRKLTPKYLLDSEAVLVYDPSYEFAILDKRKMEKIERQHARHAVRKIPTGMQYLQPGNKVNVYFYNSGAPMFCAVHDSLDDKINVNPIHTNGLLAPVRQLDLPYIESVELVELAECYKTEGNTSSKQTIDPAPELRKMPAGMQHLLPGNEVGLYFGQNLEAMYCIIKEIDKDEIIVRPRTADLAKHELQRINISTITHVVLVELSECYKGSEGESSLVSQNSNNSDNDDDVPADPKLALATLLGVDIEELAYVSANVYSYGDEVYTMWRKGYHEKTSLEPKYIGSMYGYDFYVRDTYRNGVTPQQVAILIREDLASRRGEE